MSNENPSSNSRSAISRRRFLQGAGAAAVGVSLTSLPLGFTERAAAQTGARSLVCLFLAGGADSFNMYVPLNNSQAGRTYDAYRSVRSGFAVPSNQLLSIGDGSFGLHPDMTNMAELAGSGRMAVVRNVGTLVRPTDRDQFMNGISLPEDLFAHDSQQKLWQTGRPRLSINQGWGDAIAGAVAADEPATLAPAFSIAGSNRWQAGANSGYTRLSPSSDVQPLDGYTNTRSWIPSFERVATTLETVRQSAAGGDRLDRLAAETMRRSVVATNELESALEVDPRLAMSDVASHPLGAQLRRVATLIYNREMLGMGRQVFFVQIGGWDTHGQQDERLPLLISMLDRCVGSFTRALDAIGVGDSVTTFTASDFGRTLTSNGDGTDHGWGGHSFVMGGAVNAGDYGTFPDYSVRNNDDDASDGNGEFAGRLIPTTSVSQYGATLARWMGLNDTQLDRAFPELVAFSERDLGFL